METPIRNFANLDVIEAQFCVGLSRKIHLSGLRAAVTVCIHTFGETLAY